MSQIGHTVIQIGAVHVANGATLIKIPNYQRTIEIIGDSLSAGQYATLETQIFGDGEQVRTFTHARDIATALLTIFDRDLRNDDFNICGNSTETILELAAKIWRRVNNGEALPCIKHMPVPPSDVRFRVGVSEKLRAATGWRPQYDIDDIIADTYRFVSSALG